MFAEIRRQRSENSGVGACGKLHRRGDRLYLDSFPRAVICGGNRVRNHPSAGQAETTDNICQFYSIAIHRCLHELALPERQAGGVELLSTRQASRRSGIGGVARTRRQPVRPEASCRKGRTGTTPPAVFKQPVPTGDVRPPRSSRSRRGPCELLGTFPGNMVSGLTTSEPAQCRAALKWIQ